MKKNGIRVHKRMFKKSKRTYKKCNEIDEENFWLYVDVGLIIYMKVIRRYNVR